MTAPEPAYAPSWLPIPRNPWVLVDVHSGAFYPRPGKDEASKRFATAEAALTFARKHRVKLARAEVAP